MRRSIKLIVAGVLAAVVALPAAAAADESAPPELPRNPKAACDFLEEHVPELYEFIGTQPGGCVSTIASVGLDGLLSGQFPSQASAIGACKQIEQQMPDGYPFQFYGFVPGLVDMLLATGTIDTATHADLMTSWNEVQPHAFAKNRAGCVRSLRFFHGGGMNALFGKLGPYLPQE